MSDGLKHIVVLAIVCDSSIIDRFEHCWKMPQFLVCGKDNHLLGELAGDSSYVR